MKQQVLIEQLIGMCEQHIQRAMAMNKLSDDLLNRKPSPERWSILECFEHLNRYGDFYLPEFEKRILAARRINSNPEFRSGWFGEYTVQDMLPKKGKVRKMNTFKDKNPSGSDLNRSVLDRFVKQEKQLISLLEKSRGVHLKKVKCSLTLPVLKFRLGTTFRFVIYHAERHLWQADNVHFELNKRSA